MSSKLGNGTAWLKFKLIGSLLGLFCVSELNAQDNSQIAQSTTASEIIFTAKPANCVALHQGRKCYASVSLQWQAPQQGNFCIYQKMSNKVIQCWKNSNGSQVQFEFESSTKLEYQLVAIEKNHVLAETAIDVSWVHKASPRKRRWRLF
ncbi:DUF3019 domain-containing protein [Colwellia sp. 1_MG-2023]|uniref:DUF3019 domain-containing protein n=1 Tax=Colwellia sp. 1_MG-2023 TaxID=3062649 RepID=UPI0026E137DC|nr:DUF3019 domain-containing protein [Colwellia sp. 1_MG-2023]MDO6444454.1 DUF3019 domain-containing protein [Colwellia sp. 1_MG-2023]